MATVAVQAETARRPHRARNQYQAKPTGKPKPKCRPASNKWLTYLLPVMLFACSLWYVSIYAGVTMYALEHARLKHELARQSNVNARLTVQAQAMVSAERAKSLGRQAGMLPATRFDRLSVPERVASVDRSIR